MACEVQCEVSCLCYPRSLRKKGFFSGKDDLKKNFFEKKIFDIILAEN